LNKYNTKQEWINVESGYSKLLGFQQVLTDSDKVHVWFKEEVDYPLYQNRHRTTRLMNNSNRVHNWGKSVWRKDKLWESLSYQLTDIGVTYQHFIDLEDDAISDKWQTKGDGFRNFLKAELINPYCERTRLPLRIQITQSSNVPNGIYSRALAESELGKFNYIELVAKYEEQARIKMYTPLTVNCSNGKYNSKFLMPVYTEVDGNRVYVYETSEIVIGSPHHVFVEYKLDIKSDVIKFAPNVFVNLNKINDEEEIELSINT